MVFVSKFRAIPLQRSHCLNEVLGQSKGKACPLNIPRQYKGMDIQFSLGEITSLPKENPRLQMWLLWFPALWDRKVVEGSLMLTSAEQDKRKRLEASTLVLIQTKALFIIQPTIKMKFKNQIIIPTKVTAAFDTLGNKSQMRSSPWGSQMMGQSALSARMTPNWVIHQRLCCHPEGPLQAEEMGWQPSWTTHY